MLEGLFEYAPATDPMAHGQWRLASIDLYNWGTLQGLHHIDVPRKGLLITGESGSGKSTILDALSTVMMPDASTQLNAAASGGISGDSARSRLSYVRGAFAQELDEESNEAKTVFLRSGATKSGIALTFDNRQGKTWVGMRVFHATAGASSPSQLTQGFFSSDHPLSLSEVIEKVVDGNFVRSIKAAFPQIERWENSKSFHAHLIRKVGIGATTAAALLHKTMATKNVSSLNRLMRDYMLEPPQTFKSAETAAEQFQNLKLAHEDVVKARQQIALLLPMRVHKEDEEQARQERTRVEYLLELLPVYRAHLQSRRAKAATERLTAVLRELESRNEEIATRMRDITRDQENYRVRFNEGGGHALSRVEEKLTQVRMDRRRVAATRQSFASFIVDLPSVELPTSPVEFQAVLAMAAEQLASIDVSLSEAEEQIKRHAVTENKHQEEIRLIERELHSLKYRQNALPADIVEVREALARHIGVSVATFPFVAELVQVKSSEWRGAAERLLRPLARTMLVTEEYAQRVAQWVNGRRLTDSTGRGVDLTYEKVPVSPKEPTQFLVKDSIIAHLEIKDHPHHAWLKERLVSRFNYTCVDDPRQLRNHDYSLTREGLIRAKGTHTKRDRWRVDDREHWILGWSNHERVEHLRERHRETLRAVESAANAMKALEENLHAMRQEQAKLQRVAEFSWPDIDEKTWEEREQQLHSQWVDMSSRNTSLKALTVRIEQLKEEYDTLSQELRDNDQQLGSITHALEDVRKALAQAQQTLDSHDLAADDEAALAAACGQTHQPVEDLDPQVAVDGGRDVLTKAAKNAEDRIHTAARKLHEIQTAYIADWPQFAANLTTQSQDIPDFLLRLERLESDNLPRFEERFRELLRDQTQKEMSSLALEIREYYKGVRRRIEPVNASLAQTPYNQQRNTFLRIEPTHVLSRDTREFLDDLKQITEGQFSQREESAQAAEARYAKIEKLMFKLSSQENAMVNWRQEVLDTRRHVTFRAIEYTADREQVDVYESSAGRSGGQSQKLVTFALAAALRYQLADPGHYVPRFGTVVLDEAFDKTDTEFARASLDIFMSFGFQLVMASPMKMNQTVEPYVGGVVQTRMSNQNHTELAFATYHEEEADA